jgi:hypothetical protein
MGRDPTLITPADLGLSPRNNLEPAVQARKLTRTDPQLRGDPGTGFLQVELDPLIVTGEAVHLDQPLCTTVPLIRISARSMASITGATSSTTCRCAPRRVLSRSGPGRTCSDRYVRTVRRFSPVSRAISERLIASDRCRARNRRSSNQRCGSKTAIVSRPSRTQQERVKDCRSSPHSTSGTEHVHPYVVEHVSSYPDTDGRDLESLMRGNAHAGFGERSEETGRWPHRHRAAGRLNHPGAQLRFTDADGPRLTAFATNTTDAPIASLELRHRQRARAEDRIRNARATGLRNLPPHHAASNQI